MLFAVGFFDGFYDQTVKITDQGECKEGISNGNFAGEQQKTQTL